MSTFQLTFFEKTIEELLASEIKDLKNDISQMRKSMFARQGEFMKSLADLQRQINEMHEEKMKKETCSPELNKFFERLSELKKYIKDRALNCSDVEIVAELHDIYERLDEIFKTKEEEEDLPCAS